MATAQPDQRPRPRSATALLRADHQHVSALFAQYEKTRSSARKQELVRQICQELTVHAQIEEEIFYPALKRVLKDTELVPEATVEHDSLKYLIAQIKDGTPDGQTDRETDREMFDAKVKVLSEYVKHHVKEEQGPMFKKARESGLDLKALGAQLQQRKQALMGD